MGQSHLGRLRSKQKGENGGRTEHEVSGFLQRVFCLMSSGQKQLSLKGKDLKLQSLFCGTRACKLRCQGVGSMWITEQRSGQGQVCSGRDMLPRTPQACCLDPSWLLCHMKSSQEKGGRSQDASWILWTASWKRIDGKGVWLPLHSFLYSMEYLRYLWYVCYSFISAS